MTTRWQHFSRRHRRPLDAVLVVVLFILSGPVAYESSKSYADGLGWWSALPLAAVATAAVLARRGHPRATVLVTAVCAAAAGGVGYLLTPMLLAPVLVALYSFAAQEPPRRVYRFCLPVTAMVVLSTLFGDRYGHPWPLATVNPVLCLLLPVALGSATRIRNAYLEAVETRARYAEQTREEEARHRVAEERVRIARELHDVVAHHLALANAQAGTLTFLARTSPDKVAPMVNQLATTTSSALRELKATVGLLRQPDDPDTLEPAPGLAQLPDLIESFRTTGLDVRVTIDGKEQQLSPGVDLSAYRIVQEALTNITKHAPGGTAHARLGYGHERLTITVTNTPGQLAATPTRIADGDGFGLIGMRERARSAGGSFSAGRRSDGGFTVTAELPILP
ncbi:sensor histidine kinase [Streptomyces fuscichromogenes]|uniref:histidine kinase n=1 Tax=Streptomyces fuscichromogenes TaxID=1324013 RepID=A0A917XPY7_9ACTN|nr:sensor histidine kinase [Streptomyces fuscichromogenes]GGN44048.1 two-component sensor histidine kinase [Streptomyces fuscichromogenes]